MKGTPRGGRRRVLLLFAIPALAFTAACAQPADDAPVADATMSAQDPVTSYTADDVLLASAKVALPQRNNAGACRANRSTSAGRRIRIAPRVAA